MSDGPRALALLGAAGGWMRRAGLDGALRAAVDNVDRALLRIDRPPLTANAGDLVLRGYLRHRGFLEYVARGMTRETYYRNLMLDMVDSQTTFVDAGAHIGVYTILACHRARRVLAFEPDPYNLAALRLNVKKVGCTNVEIRSEAVAEQAGRADFRAFRSTFSGSLAPREVDVYRELVVDTVSLDEALKNSDLASLVVKLDVEGAEPLALAGMSNTIVRARRLAIFAEANPEALEAGGSSVERLVDGFLLAGLKCAWIDEEQRTLGPVPKTGYLAKGNLVCLKRSPPHTVKIGPSK